MIVASGIELRAGARLLLAEASFQVAEGDRIGLVGRNGAGKTTLAKVLSGTGLPAAGTVRHSGTVGYLPQDPRTGDLEGRVRQQEPGTSTQLNATGDDHDYQEYRIRPAGP